MDAIDEQVLLNIALKNLGVAWTKTTSMESICSIDGWISNDDPIKIYVLPQEQFCRKCCRKVRADSLYSTHPIVDKSNLQGKSRALTKIKSWFLENSWQDSVNSSLKGDKWLKVISQV